MNRLPAIIASCFLGAFLAFFLDGMFNAPDFFGSIFCGLISAAVGCGVIMAVNAAITGNSIL